MLKIATVLFENFELLDVFGPLEIFGLLPEHFSIHLVAEKQGYVASAQGPRSVVDHVFDDGDSYDVLLVPGGQGTRSQINNRLLLDWLKNQAESAQFVTSVCTGSALLAKSGLLNGHKATTNKRAYNWVKSQSQHVNWIAEARWVEDGKFFTSSGVSAGIDMSLGLIQHVLGKKVAEQVADWAEYEWHSDSSWDPFAKRNGLI